MAVITRTFPAQRRGSAMALWGATAGVATLVGPVLGGVLVARRLGVDLPGQRPGGRRRLRARRRLVPTLPTHSHAFDWVGVALSALGMFLLAGVRHPGGREVRLGHHHPASSRCRCSIGGGLVCSRCSSGGSRGSAPSRSCRWACSATATSRCRTSASPPSPRGDGHGAAADVLGPARARLQPHRVRPAARAHGRHDRPAGPGRRPTVDRVHPRSLVAVGFAAASAAIWWLMVIVTPERAVWQILLPMALFGVGSAFLWAPLSTTATRKSPAQRGRGRRRRLQHDAARSRPRSAARRSRRSSRPGSSRTWASRRAAASRCRGRAPRCPRRSPRVRRRHGRVAGAAGGPSCWRPGRRDVPGAAHPRGLRAFGPTSLHPWTASYVLTLPARPPRLVHAVSRWVAEAGGNILDSQQFTDTASGQFFLRLHFDLPTRATPSSCARRSRGGGRARDGRQPGRGRGAPAHDRHGVQGPALPQRLQFRQSTGGLNIQIRRSCRTTRTPSGWPAPTTSRSTTCRSPPTRRPGAEARLLELVAELDVDLVVLARYMQILSDDLCRALEAARSTSTTRSCPASRARGRTTRPPARREADRATAHYVNRRARRGPDHRPGVLRGRSPDGSADLARVGRDEESQTLSRAVRLHSESRVLMDGPRTVVFD